MFDTYSQCGTHTRVETFSHPETLPTWMDMVRKSKEADIEVQLRRVFSESPLCMFAAKLLAGFRRWKLQLSRWPARKARISGHYLPVKRHSPVHR